MTRPNHDIPPDQRTTFGRSHAVRLAEYDYKAEATVHLTMCALRGNPFADHATAQMICTNVEFYCNKYRYRLFGYTLMPDHLHVLLSTGDSGRAVEDWLRDFKSYTTHEYRKRSSAKQLWQRSAYDHVCRAGETAERVLAYIIDNPVRTGLAERWMDWPWTKVFIAI
jgi:REP element-mobilizing transposase RayT